MTKIQESPAVSGKPVRYFSKCRSVYL